MEQNEDLKLFWLDTDTLSDKAWCKECYARLSGDRQHKIDACRSPKDKQRSLGAGLLLDRGLSEYGLREASVKIALGQHGKPYLPDHPHIHFNLSHSGEKVLAVFASTPVGCDVQKLKKADLKLARRFFREEEYAYIAAQPDELQGSRAFCRIWTLKESFLKAVGTGLRTPLNSFGFQLLGDGSAVLRQSLCPDRFRFLEYELPAYQAAVCVTLPDRN